MGIGNFIKKTFNDGTSILKIKKQLDEKKSDIFTKIYDEYLKNGKINNENLIKNLKDFHKLIIEKEKLNIEMKENVKNGKHQMNDIIKDVKENINDKIAKNKDNNSKNKDNNEETSNKEEK